jgi:hypothetical protein
MTNHQQLATELAILNLPEILSMLLFLSRDP